MSDMGLVALPESSLLLLYRNKGSILYIYMYECVYIYTYYATMCICVYINACSQPEVLHEGMILQCADRVSIFFHGAGTRNPALPAAQDALARPISAGGRGCMVGMKMMSLITVFVIVGRLEEGSKGMKA